MCQRIFLIQHILNKVAGLFFFFYRYIIAHTFKNIKTLSPGTNILGVPGKKQKEIPN